MQRLTLRIGRNTLAILAQDEESDTLTYEPVVVKSGISMAANLREAFKSSSLLSQNVSAARVLIDSNTLMVPVELFSEQTMEEMHNHAFPRQEQDTILYNVQPDLNAVAVFAMNKDLKLVLDDHFQSIRLIAAMSPVWRHMHRRSFTGSKQKLYAYFHEKRLELCSFQQNRFKFCNSFEANRAPDALYFMLYVWQQLQLRSKYDELCLMGDVPEKDWMMQQLKKYVLNTIMLNPQTEYNMHPVTEIKGVPFDLQTLVVKGR
ncbi:MAG: DUF3822 family protein [Prevotella sp.]|nr:DUF3822 family protein [Prevotella sp.]